MQFGLFMMPLHPPHRPYADGYQRDVDQIVLADRLGTRVTLLALHNPVYLAHRLAMLDHMARGRFQWGIGGGAIPTDLALFGLDPATPASVRARSAEVLEVVLKLWASEGQFSHHGTFFDIETPLFDPVKD